MSYHCQHTAGVRRFWRMQPAAHTPVRRVVLCALCGRTVDARVKAETFDRLARTDLAIARIVERAGRAAVMGAHG